MYFIEISVKVKYQISNRERFKTDSTENIQKSVPLTKIGIFLVITTDALQYNMTAPGLAAVCRFIQPFERKLLFFVTLAMK